MDVKSVFYVSLKSTVMQCRKSSDGGRIRVECLEKKKKICLYNPEILFNEFGNLMIKIVQGNF